MQVKFLKEKWNKLDPKVKKTIKIIAGVGGTIAVGGTIYILNKNKITKSVADYIAKRKEQKAHDDLCIDIITELMGIIDGVPENELETITEEYFDKLIKAGERAA